MPGTTERKQNYRITVKRQRGVTGERKSKKKDEKKKTNHNRWTLRNCLAVLPYLYLNKELAVCAECKEDLGIVSHHLGNSGDARFIFHFQ